jgi:uncharacterized hydantoinase/oxoprolinase family protein
MSVVIGWDVGGAHLEAARAEGGRIVAAIQIASPLWLGVSRLDEAFRTARSELGSAHAATMTGELSMAFTSRSEGVAALAALTASALAPAPLRFYAGRVGFVSLEAVSTHASDVASANWHASAALIARCRRWSSRWGRRRPTSFPSSRAPSRRAATPTRNGWRPGARLRRPRAELGIRERKPCALPPEA